MSEEEKEFVVEIDGIRFNLIEYDENAHNKRGLLKIKSIDRTGIEKEFCVYRSNSEGGFWRFACADERHILFKGNYDYIQQTFIHLELQKFINENLIFVKKNTISEVSCNKETIDFINSELRKHNFLHPSLNGIKCGEVMKLI